MIFLLEPRYLSLDAGRSLRGRSVSSPAASPARIMPRAALLLVAIACLHQAAARPVRRTLNFNMFLLQPHKNSQDRVLLTTDGVSRFGPLLEYFIQRVQGMMSVRLPQHHQQNDDIATADTAENEVDAATVPDTRMPGVVVRPSRTKPGTYEVEINVVVDDGQPDDKKNFSNN